MNWLSSRAGTSHGVIGSMLLLVCKPGLAEAIDRRLHLLKIHRSYPESGHVLNLAFSVLCDANSLQELELGTKTRHR